MYKKHDAGVRAPYESPEAEMLLIRLEERFLDGTFNAYGLEKYSVEEEETL